MLFWGATMPKHIQLKDSVGNVYPNPYFPVGAIYLSMNNTNPTTYFGGTWSLIAQGRTLVGVDTNDSDFNTPNKSGGAKTHTLAITEIPSHNHSIYCPAGGTGTYAATWTETTTTYPYAGSTFAGGGLAHNNLQPYLTCYIWTRTA